MKNDAKPTLIRNTIANTPSILYHREVGSRVSPNAKATKATIPAWNIALTLAESTFDRIMADRETGVLNTLFMKPKRLSQTTDMPVNAVVKTTVNATMLIAMNEK